MENTQTPTTTESTTTPAATEGTKPGCWALVAHAETGEVRELFAKTKRDLAKQIELLGIKFVLLGAFKGKKLNSVKKVSIKLN